MGGVAKGVSPAITIYASKRIIIGSMEKFVFDTSCSHQRLDHTHLKISTQPAPRFGETTVDLKARAFVKLRVKIKGPIGPLSQCFKHVKKEQTP